MPPTTVPATPADAPMPDAPRKASLLIIFLTVFIDLLGFGMVLPLLPLYGKQFAAQHGFTPAQTGWIIGLLMASFSLMQFLFLPVWGRLSDRYGRRPILLLGLAGSTFFYAMFGFAAAGRSLIGLFIARIGAGIAGATISTAQAYIADVTTKEKRAKGMALIGAAFALGFTLGPLLGAAALLAGGEAQPAVVATSGSEATVIEAAAAPTLASGATLSPWPGFVASGLSGAALLLAVFLLVESWRPDAERAGRSWFDLAALRDALATPSIGLLLLTSFIAVFSFANFESTLSVLIEKIMVAFEGGSLQSPLLGRATAAIRGWGYSQREDITLIVVLGVFAYLGCVLTLAQGFLVRRLAGRLSEATMAVIGGAGAIGGFLLLALATSRNDFRLVLIGLAVEVTGFAFVNPSLQSLISRRSDPARQGGILGLSQSATSLARILGPVCGMRLFAASPVWPYWAATALMGVGLLLVIVAARTGRDYMSPAT